MVACHFVEVSLLHAQLFLVLFFQDLEIEIEEALDLGRVGQREAVDVLEEAFERRQQVVVHLLPLGREILFNEYTRHQRQLAVGVVAENAFVR